MTYVHAFSRQRKFSWHLLPAHLSSTGYFLFVPQMGTYSLQSLLLNYPHYNRPAKHLSTGNWTDHLNFCSIRRHASICIIQCLENGICISNQRVGNNILNTKNVPEGICNRFVMIPFCIQIRHCTKIVHGQFPPKPQDLLHQQLSQL